MSQSSEIPLHLYQVLEEEYLSMHGALPADETTTIQLPGATQGKWRKVTSKRDWLFHPGHITDPVGFAVNLLLNGEAARREQEQQPRGQALARRAAQSLQPYEWMRGRLKDYLREKIDGETLRALSETGSSLNDERLSELEQRLASDLNRLISDPNLYDEERFSQTWLSDACQRLLELRESKGEAFDEKQLIHLNRLLLEDAFPQMFEKVSNIRLAAMYKRLHEKEQRALSFSGGGIRSGTFALGIIQGLARRDLLRAFDYLSTVSGGGYIGSWLTAWLHRHPKGLEGVTEDLANSAPVKRIDPDPPPLHYLREYSSFVTPKVGLLTADTWTFVGIYLRNLLLNWMVFIPLLIMVLLIPRLFLAVTLAQPLSDATDAVSLFFHTNGMYLLLALGFGLGVWGLSYIIFNRPSTRFLLIKRSPFWRTRTDQRSFLVWCLLPLLLAAICLTTYWAWLREHGEVTRVTPFLIFGVAFTLTGWLIASFILRRLFRWRELSGYELLGLLVAGLGGGAFFYLLSRILNSVSKPVIGYNEGFHWQRWEGWLVWRSEIYICCAVPLFLLVFWMGTTLFIGATSRSQRINDDDREWWARFGAWLLIATICWSVFNVLVIFGPLALYEFPIWIASIGGLSGLISILVGRSSKTPAKGSSAEQKQGAGGAAKSILADHILPLLALVFVVFFVIALSAVTSWIIRELALLFKRAPDSLVDWLTNVPNYNNVPGYSAYINYISVYDIKEYKHPVWTTAKLAHMNVLHHTSTWYILGLGLVLLGFGMLLSKLINLNLFSLHGGYRNRLIRAFLGASRPPGERKPNPFTGFDPADNLHMHELRPALFDESDFIAPQRLLRDLTDDAQPLSIYLSRKELLQNVRAVPTDAASPRLIAALRTDLNSVIEDENIRLYQVPELQSLLKGERALRAQRAIDGSKRSDYHILLNRLILEEAYPEAIKPCAYPPPPYKLFHVINTTLNLVGGDNLAWQQRNAEPFSISPLHSGCFRLGYRRSKDYGGKDYGGISIGTAAAISGAAASSNMGYYTTSPVLSLLLTLFNVRLGWWLGNPGPAGEQTYQLPAPKYSTAPVIYEAFGMTDDRNKYVYLTDGGHFENLALYEMVLRRCHVIVCADAAADPDYRFGDLGNAVRKIRIDLGVPIEFTNIPIYAAPPTEGKGFYWAIGKIRYMCIDGPDAKDGVLLYIKPAVYGDEPRDVLEYKKSFPAFPHQSTGDQFFDEPQFESYRMLGSFIMDQICGEGNDPMAIYKLVSEASRKLTENADKSTAADPGLATWIKEWSMKTD